MTVGRGHSRDTAPVANLIAIVLGWLGRNLGLFLLILASVVVAAWLRGEWRELQAREQRIATQAGVVAALESQLAGIDARLGAEAAAWRAQVERVARPYRERLASIDAAVARAAPQWQVTMQRVADLDGHVAAARRAADEAKAQLDVLEKASRPWDWIFDPQALARLEAARVKHATLAASADATRRLREDLEPTLERSPVRALLREREGLAGEIDRLARSASPRQLELATEQARGRQRLEAERARLAALERVAASDPRRQLLARIRAALPAALGIFAAVLIVPLLVKALFYFVLAPAAARMPPIRVLPGPGAPPLSEPAPSAVSAAVDVPPGSELLVRTGFLQSSALDAHKRTRWLLNARLPFASLASGMFALTAVRPAAGEPTRVVVASQDDALGEVCVLDLPAGAAMVLQPRSLAGIVQRADSPLRITRHWRHRSAHGWLTLQLRYLVFHGPCRLILKGCRGVCAEQPDAGRPRLINQAATLGFSANLDYQVTRTETFLPYLRGQEGLFNDLFSGGPGRFVYEAMPAGGRGAGIAGRGLEGVVDAVLDAVGI